MRSFDLVEKFRLILIPAQSLSHLDTCEDVEKCFSYARQHLAEEGRFVIELFNPSLQMLVCESGRRSPVGQFEDPKAGSQVFVTEAVGYDAASQIDHIQWFFRNQGSDQETVLSLEMGQFFPQEINTLLWYNHFVIEHKYGNYKEEEFSSDVWKQIIICHL